MRLWEKMGEAWIEGAGEEEEVDEEEDWKEKE